MLKDFRVIGKNVIRNDGLAKVTGKARYIVDLGFPGMLYGKILRCPYPHAKVVRINTERAKAMPGVKAVVTPEDAPQIKYCSAGSLPCDLLIEDENVLTTHARHIGDRVAAVAAESIEQAEAAIRQIEVDYELLPSVLDIETARKGIVDIHEGGNLAATFHFEEGNAIEALEGCQHLVEGVYDTTRIQHVNPERTACICQWDVDGTLNVWATSQVLYHDRRILSHIFGIPLSKVRVSSDFVGSGFGNRQQLHQQPIATLLALKTGCPVKVENDREEDMTSSATRHPFTYHMITGVKDDGTIESFRAKAAADTGAYATLGPVVVAATSSKLQYLVPNYSYEGQCYYTNNPVAGAFRGFGNPQFTYAREVHMDEVADKMGMDPIEFRLKNHLRVGDFNPTRGPKDWRLNSCGIEECAKKAMEYIGWKEKRKWEVNADNSVKKGIGTAFCMQGSGASFNDHSTARVIINEDGSANVLVGVVEIGQGSDTALAQICAEELGINYSDVKIYSADTAFGSTDMGTHASRVTFVTGNAVKRAAAEARGKLIQHAAEMLDTTVENIEIVDQRCVSRDNPQVKVSFQEVTWDAYYGVERRTLDGHSSYLAEDAPPPFGVCIAEVEVDMETGFIKVQQVVAAFDVGKAINPYLVEGQIIGGIVQGLGYALFEKMVMDNRTKKFVNCNLLDYKIPTTMDLPHIHPIIVETNEISGPFGAKSIGEVTILPIAPAIANAVYHATGVRVRSLPLTPDVVWRHLRQSKTRRG